MLSRKKGHPQIFPSTMSNDTMVDHTKYNMLLLKNSSTTKVWVVSLILCFAICVTVVSVTVWIVSMMRVKSTNNDENNLGLQSSMKYSDHYGEDDYINVANVLEHVETPDKKNVELTEKKIPEISTIKTNSLNEDTQDDEMSLNAALESINLKKIVFQAVGSLTNVAVDRLKERRLPQVDKNQNLDKSDQMAPVKDAKKTNPLPIMVADVSKKLLEEGKNISGYLNHRTQISSPGDMIAQATTTNLGDLLKKDKVDSKEEMANDESQRWKPTLSVKKKNSPFMNYFNIFGKEFITNEDIYDNDDYFYSETDAQAFYYDYERITWAEYILEKIQELYNWITTDFDDRSKGNENAPLPQILKALNYTIVKGDASVLFSKLRELYYSENNTDFDPEKSRKMLTNTTSVASFGLLAVDIIILRNMQLMAWEDQNISETEIFKDPEVFALNAIFMDPEKVKVLHEEIQQSQTNGGLNVNSDRRFLHKKLSYTSSEEETQPGFFEEFIRFITSTFRAMIHLGQAFRTARHHIQNENIRNLVMGKSEAKNDDSNISNNTLELDCIWTLYCTNLDKATQLGGPYGFLAKMNSIGLRLLMGSLRIERVIETFIEESLNESKKLNCDALFPKCNGRNASKIVLDEILRMSPNKEIHR